MAAVHDVAAYVLSKKSPITAMKLQKLLYYSQAWSLVWNDKPLFKARIEAWVNGPVVPEIYQYHRGKYEVTNWTRGDAGNLDARERRAVDAVLKFYGTKTSQWLSNLTHQEDPWIKARRGALPGQQTQNEITTAAMAEYYSSL